MNLLRQIENVVKPKWDEIKNGKKYTGTDEDCPPILLNGWTDDNPSLWEIDNPIKPKLESILVALCRRKKDWDKITYLCFDASVVTNAKLSLSQTSGNTGDTKIDISKTHYEIKEITGKGLCTLIYYIMTSNFEVGLFKKTDFDKIILTAYDKSQISLVAETDSTSKLPIAIPAFTNTVLKSNKTNEGQFDRKYKTITSGSTESNEIKNSTNTTL
jgi:hypothetical protein